MYCFTCPLHICIPRKISYVKVCCPGILNMYPCNLNNPVDFKTHFVTPQTLSCGRCEAAWNTRGCTLKCCTFQDLCAICTQKCCIFPGFLCSRHPKVLQISWFLCSLHPKVLQLPGFLCSLFPARAPEMGGVPGHTTTTDKHKRTGPRRGARHRPEPLHDPYVTLT